MLNQKNFFLFN